jgi:hypothetical protein
MIQLITLLINPVNYYLMAATNKQLLISESRGDSNRCTPYRGKPDQHDTYASHASPRTLGIRFLRAIPIWGNILRVIDIVEQAHCSREKGLPTQSSVRRQTDPRVHTQLLSRANQWSSGGKVKHLLAVVYWAYMAHITSMRSIRSIISHEYQPLGP